jgi:hypothetical protein
MADSNNPASARTRDQRLAEEALVPHPHRLELRGSPESLAWPSICAYCGSAANERIRVQKAFYNRRHRSRQSALFNYRIFSADIPFCVNCAAQHRHTLPQRSPWSQLRTFVLNPAHIATVGFAWLLYTFTRSLADATSGSGATVAWGLLGLFVFGLLWTPAVVWWMTRPDRLEPRTDVTKACDFSGNAASPFERARHIYMLRNGAFADALGQLNRDRVWTEGDQRRMMKRSPIVALVLLAALIGARLALWFFTGK